MLNLKYTYILVRQVFKGDNYSREETINLLDFFSATSIQGRQLFKGGNYSRKYGMPINIFLALSDHNDFTHQTFLSKEPNMLKKT